MFLMNGKSKTALTQMVIMACNASERIGLQTFNFIDSNVYTTTYLPKIIVEHSCFYSLVALSSDGTDMTSFAGDAHMLMESFCTCLPYGSITVFLLEARDRSKVFSAERTFYG